MEHSIVIPQRIKYRITMTQQFHFWESRDLKLFVNDIHSIVQNSQKV